ncbi:MAG TPA: OsmC family protein [Gammaproteobacteria bacterium]|nr:OsmC family protein [Gammaproteobacteria bacterium]
MKASVTLRDGVCFEGRTDSGHTLVMDGAPEQGGQNNGPRPMEMLLLGLGGCTAFDVVTILRRGRQQVSDCQVEISAQRAPEDPKVFTEITLHYRLFGTVLSSKRVAKAIELSAKKYCSASIMLGKTAIIRHDFEIIERGTS